MAEESGFLVADLPGATAILRTGLNLVKNLCENAAPHAVQHEVRLPRTCGRDLRVLLQPLRGGTSARVLITIEGVTDVIELDRARLEMFFGLTPTEADLAIALASGLTVASFAAARGCSEQTARTHLKHVLDKTECRRQVEIVLLLLTNAWLRAEPRDPR